MPQYRANIWSGTESSTHLQLDTFSRQLSGISQGQTFFDRCICLKLLRRNECSLVTRSLIIKHGGTLSCFVLFFAGCMRSHLQGASSVRRLRPASWRLCGFRRSKFDLLLHSNRKLCLASSLRGMHADRTDVDSRPR